MVAPVFYVREGAVNGNPNTASIWGAMLINFPHQPLAGILHDETILIYGIGWLLKKYQSLSF
jgi:hypothetical protein